MVPTESQQHSSLPSPLDLDKLSDAYKKSTRRMFFMDYDGTLAPLVDKPENATPTAELKALLERLSNDARNRIYIVSGRDRKALQNWLGDLRLGLSAEHGCFIRPLVPPSADVPEIGQWKDLVKEDQCDVSWRDKVISVFNKYAEKLQGSTVECKEYAITFHYRMCDKAASKSVVHDLREELHGLTEQYSTLNALKGRKSVEARLKNVTKGIIVRRILDTNKRDGIDFVLSIGDDLTDEDMFKELDHDKALSDGVFTCTVNFRGSVAQASVKNQPQVLGALGKLADLSDQKA